MKVRKKYKPLFEKEKLEELANLTKEDTGLDYIIWIFPKTNKEGHWARIKVQIDKNNRVPMSISDTPEWKADSVDVPANKGNKIKKWIKLNKGVLLEYWNSEGELSLKTVFSKLQRV